MNSSLPLDEQALARFLENNESQKDRYPIVKLSKILIAKEIEASSTKLTEWALIAWKMFLNENSSHPSLEFFLYSSLNDSSQKLDKKEKSELTKWIEILSTLDVSGREWEKNNADSKLKRLIPNSQLSLKNEMNQDSSIDVHTGPKWDLAHVLDVLTYLYSPESDPRVNLIRSSWDIVREANAIHLHHCNSNHSARFFQHFYHEHSKKPYIHVLWDSLSSLLQINTNSTFQSALPFEVHTLNKLKRDHTNFFKDFTRTQKDYFQSLKTESHFLFDQLHTFQTHFLHLMRMQTQFKSNLTAYQESIQNLKPLDLIFKSTVEKFKEKRSTIDPTQLAALKSHVRHSLDEYVRQTLKLSESLLRLLQNELNQTNHYVQEKLSPFFAQLIQDESMKKKLLQGGEASQDFLSSKLLNSFDLSQWNDFHQSASQSLEKLSSYLPQNIQTLSNHLEQIKSTWVSPSKQVGAWLELFSKPPIQKLTKQAFTMRKNLFHHLEESCLVSLPHHFLTYRLVLFFSAFMDHAKITYTHGVDKIRSQFDNAFSELELKSQSLKTSFHDSLQAGWHHLQLVLYRILQTTVEELARKDSVRCSSPLSFSSSSTSSVSSQLPSEASIETVLKKKAKLNSKSKEKSNTTVDHSSAHLLPISKHPDKETNLQSVVSTASKNKNIKKEESPKLAETAINSNKTFKENEMGSKHTKMTSTLEKSLVFDHLDEEKFTKESISLQSTSNSFKVPSKKSRKGETIRQDTVIETDSKLEENPNLLTKTSPVSQPLVSVSILPTNSADSLTSNTSISEGETVASSFVPPATLIEPTATSVLIAPMVHSTPEVAQRVLPPPPALPVLQNELVSSRVWDPLPSSVSPHSMPMNPHSTSSGTSSVEGTLPYPPPFLPPPIHYNSSPSPSPSASAAMPITSVPPATAIWQPLPITTVNPTIYPSTTISSLLPLPPVSPTPLPAVTATASVADVNSSYASLPAPQASPSSLFEALMYENGTLRTWVHQLQCQVQQLEHRLLQSTLSSSSATTVEKNKMITSDQATQTVFLPSHSDHHSPHSNSHSTSHSHSHQQHQPQYRYGGARHDASHIRCSNCFARGHASDVCTQSCRLCGGSGHGADQCSQHRSRGAG